MRRIFSPARNRAALRRLARRLRRERRGMAAVEFALIVPALLAVYFGVVEVGQGVMIDRKVVLLNRSLADLTAQYATISNTELNNIFDAASVVMLPFTASDPRMSIASVVVDSGGTARVCWSTQRNSTVPGRNTVVTLPPDLRVPNTSVIMATASYDFTPTVGYVLTGPITIGGDPIFMRPRIGKVGGTGGIEQVERNGAAMCPPYTGSGG